MKTLPKISRLWTALLPLALILGLSLPLGAQDLEPEVPSETDEESLFDDFSLLVEEDNTDTADTGALEFLTSESAVIGGNFSFLTQGRLPLTVSPSFDDAQTSAELKGELFLDARPEETFRFFFKGRVNYEYDGSSAQPVFSLVEMFTDTSLGQGVEMRAGKQSLKWGVGYQFSPADLVSLSRVNPSDPDAQREGPIALRLQKAFETTNLQLVVPVDKMFEGGNPALAPKVEFVLGSTELGLSGLLRDELPSAVAATVSTSLWDLDFYGEIVAQYGSSVSLLEYDGALLTAEAKSTQWFPLATVGTQFSYADEDNLFKIFVNVQYYFNGQGYADPDILKDPQLGSLLLSSDITTSDLTTPGQHYGGGFLTWTDLLGLPFNLGVFATHNFTDASGLVDVSLTFTTLEFLPVTIGFTTSYGEESQQFTTALPDPVVYLQVEMGLGDF